MLFTDYPPITLIIIINMDFLFLFGTLIASLNRI